jgi:hypothetical protein
MVDHLSGTEAAQGVHFLTRVSDVIEIVQPAIKASAASRARKRPSP